MIEQGQPDPSKDYDIDKQYHEQDYPLTEDELNKMLGWFTTAEMHFLDYPILSAKFAKFIPKIIQALQLQKRIEEEIQNCEKTISVFQKETHEIADLRIIYHYERLQYLLREQAYLLGEQA